MPLKRRVSELSVFFALGVGVLAAVPAHARGVCYGDCSGNVVVLVVLAPLVFIYLKFWNSRKGGPSFGLCLGYIVFSSLVALVLGYALLKFLSLPMWSVWMSMAFIVVGAFALLIHPRRHEIRK